MNHKNIIKKYGISEEELKKGIETMMQSITQICNFDVVLAITDLLVSGDIKEEKQ